jgi:RNA polymerase sigma factor (TIGR02999 family)
MPSPDPDTNDADYLELVYDELRRLASGLLARENAGHTLQPTALVHEAYLRVARQSDVEWKNPAHLRALSAIAMRRVLVDHARGKQTAKRGGAMHKVTLDGSVLDTLELDAALKRLSEVDERRARVVELRFFAGLTNREVADELGVSETTIEADWRFARAWLNRELDR